MRTTWRAATGRGRALRSCWGRCCSVAGASWRYPLVAGLGACLVALVARRARRRPRVAPGAGTPRGDPRWSCSATSRARGALEVLGRRRRGLVRLDVAERVGSTPGARAAARPRCRPRWPVPTGPATARARRPSEGPAGVALRHPDPAPRAGRGRTGAGAPRRAGRDGGAVHRVGLASTRCGCCPAGSRSRAMMPGHRRAASGGDDSLEIGGTDLVGLHEYGMGDDLRRLHWATSARTGTLMVREDAEPSEPHVCVLLDDRAAAYRGDGRPLRGGRRAGRRAVPAPPRRPGHPVRLHTVSGRHEVVVPGSPTRLPRREQRDLDWLFAEIELTDAAEHDPAPGARPRRRRRGHRPRRRPPGARPHAGLGGHPGARRGRPGPPVSALQHLGLLTLRGRVVRGPGRAVGRGGPDMSAGTATRTRAPSGTPTRTSTPGDGGGPARALRLAWPVVLLVLGALVLATAWHRWPVSLLFALAAALPMLLLRGALTVGVSRWAASSDARAAERDGRLPRDRGRRSDAARDGARRRPAAAHLAPALRRRAGPARRTRCCSPPSSRCWSGCAATAGPGSSRWPAARVLYVAGALLTDGGADPWGLVAVLVLVVALLGWVLLDEHSEPVRQRLSVAAPVSVIGVGAARGPGRRCRPTQPFSPRALVDAAHARRRRLQPARPARRLGEQPRRRPADGSPATRCRCAWSCSTTTTAPSGPRPPPTPGCGPTARPAWTSAPTPPRRGCGCGSTGSGAAGCPPRGPRSRSATTTALVDLDTGTLLSLDTARRPHLRRRRRLRRPADGRPRGAPRCPTTPTSPATPALPGPAPPPWPSTPRGSPRTRPRPTSGPARSRSALRSGYTLSPRAISGSALWRIEDFLLGDADPPGGQDGTSEQFATAFAVLARFNGLPTRVVVGFRPGEEQARRHPGRPRRGRLRLGRGLLRRARLGAVLPVAGRRHVHPAATGAGRDPRPAGAGRRPAPRRSVPTSPATDHGHSLEQAAPTTPPGVGTGGSGPSVLATGRCAPPWCCSSSWSCCWPGRLRRLRHRRRGAAGAWAEVIDALRLAGIAAVPARAGRRPRRTGRRPARRHGHRRRPSRGAGQLRASSAEARATVRGRAAGRTPGCARTSSTYAAPRAARSRCGGAGGGPRPAGAGPRRAVGPSQPGTSTQRRSERP